MRKIFAPVIFLLFLILTPASAVKAETFVPGSIKKNTTWIKNKSPYIIKDDLIIEKNAVLTIEPGVKIVIPFQKDKLPKITVEGILYSRGKENEWISFSSSLPKPGGWEGIIFKDPVNSLSSLIEFSRIENARCAIACFKASPKIQNNILSSNEVAIVCEDHSSPSIISNTITENGIAEIYTSAIHCSLWSAPVIEKNTFEKNFGHSIYCETYSAPVINENKISNLLGANIVCASYSNPKISKNDLSQGMSEFGIILYNSSPKVTENNISNKRLYGLTAVDSSPLLYNNSFLGNYISILLIHSNPLVVENNIKQSNIGIISAENSNPELISNNMSSNIIQTKLIRNQSNIETGKKILPGFSGDSLMSLWNEKFSKEEPRKKISALFRSFLGGSWNIGLLNNETSQWKMLTKGNSHSGSANFSPDGNFIAFTSNRENNWDIFIMDSSCVNITNITKTAFYIEESPPIWSPDGKQICFQREAPECQTLLLDIAGNSIKRINPKKTEEEYPGLYPLVFVWFP